MVQSRYRLLVVSSLVLAVTIIPTGWSESPKPKTTLVVPGGNMKVAMPVSPPSFTVSGGIKPSDKSDSNCCVYSLLEMGEDPNFCKWVAETIPQVIHPGTWHDGSPGEGKRLLTYYAPAKILVVYHTPAVHAKVEAFLNNLKQAHGQGKGKTAVKSDKVSGHDHGVVPAKYAAHDSIKPVDLVTPPIMAYPVPASVHKPKHLFHFIIRYEGEGIVDDTVAGVLKDVYGQKMAKEEADAKAKVKEEAEEASKTKIEEVKESTKPKEKEKDSEEKNNNP